MTALDQYVLRLAAADMRRQGYMGSPGLAAEMWRTAAADPNTHLSGPTVALCRWYSWAKCWKHWEPLYHTRLLVMLYWAMGSGLLKRSAAKQSYSLPPPWCMQ